MAARPDGALPSGKPKPKPKKQTNASLASQLDTVAQTLQSLLARQDQLEESVKNPTAAALQRPLASQLAQKQLALGGVATMVGSPPRVRHQREDLVVPQTIAPPELLEVEEVKPLQGGEGGDLASAMLAQSAALTVTATRWATWLCLWGLVLEELKGGPSSRWSWPARKACSSIRL